MTYIHKHGSETGTIVLKDYELGISDAAYIYSSLSGVITPLKVKNADKANTLGSFSSSDFVLIDGSQDMIGSLKVNYNSNITTIDNDTISIDNGSNQTLIFNNPNSTFQRKNGNTVVSSLELKDDSKGYINSKQIWTEGNQGSGSGLDADTLDGYGGEQSLLFKSIIGDNEDLNNYVIAGLYHQNHNEYAQNGLNYPAGLAGMLTVKADGIMVYQEYWTYGQNNIKYIRTRYNGVWENWRQLADTEYIDTLAAAGCPSGMIAMWSGSSIPNGWKLCDGTNGTPDLRNKFIYGSDLNGIGNSGGSANAVVVSHSHTFYGKALPKHSHTQTSILFNGGIGDGLWNGADHGTTYNTSTSSVSAGTPSGTISTVGESGVGKNLPPYYTLAYIMKI